MITTRFAAKGLTCGHCVAAVTDELSMLDGVSAVRVDLVPHGVSNVEVDALTPVAVDAIESALDEAGDYSIVGDPRS